MVHYISGSLTILCAWRFDTKIGLKFVFSDLKYVSLDIVESRHKMRYDTNMKGHGTMRGNIIFLWFVTQSKCDAIFHQIAQRVVTTNFQELRHKGLRQKFSWSTTQRSATWLFHELWHKGLRCDFFMNSDTKVYAITFHELRHKGVQCNFFMNYDTRVYDVTSSWTTTQGSMTWHFHILMCDAVLYKLWCNMLRQYFDELWNNRFDAISHELWHKMLINIFTYSRLNQ